MFRVLGFGFRVEFFLSRVQQDETYFPGPGFDLCPFFSAYRSGDADERSAGWRQFSQGMNKKFWFSQRMKITD